MAARRLLTVMLVLFAISIIATALVPQRSEDEKPPGKSPTQTQADAGPVDPDPPIVVTLNADRKVIDVVPLEAGDILQLDVASKTADTVEIPALGLVAPVDAITPAHFELLLAEPGEIAIKLVDANRVAGKLRVSPAAAPGKSRPAGPQKP